MTLVELLVVLAILALMTTVAVTSTDVFLSQGRYETTTQTLTNIQEAVVGPPNARRADGTLLPIGFVADVGGPPHCASADPTLGLAELWAQPARVAPFAIVRSSTDPDVQVPCGWRGPYLRLAVGQNSLRDGWGNPMDLLVLSGGRAGVGDPIVAARSNGAGGNSPYNAPLTVNFAPALITVSGNISNGQPQNTIDWSLVRVTLFGPNPATGGLQELPCTVTPATDGATFTSPTVCAPGFLRAYAGNPATRRSTIVRFQRSDVISLIFQ